MSAAVRRPRIGRPPKIAKPGTRFSLGLKVTADIKQRLEQSAVASGRTQSQEAEYRIERTFSEERSLLEVLDLVYGPELAGLLLIIGDAMKDAGSLASWLFTGSIEDARSWWKHAYAYDQAAAAARRILDAAKPAGDPAPPPSTPLKLGGLPVGIGDHTASGLGADVATGILRELAGQKPGPEHDKGRPERLKRALGSIASQIKLPEGEGI